jgi:hypothetical protein
MLPNKGGKRRVTPLVPLTAQELADYSSEEKQLLGNNLVPQHKVLGLAIQEKNPSPKRKTYKPAMFNIVFQT